MEGQGYLGQVLCSSGTALQCPVQPQPFTAHICMVLQMAHPQLPSDRAPLDRKAWSSWGAAVMLKPQKFGTTK